MLSVSVAFLLGSKGGEGDEKEKGRRPRALFFGSSKVRRMSSSRPGRRRPPPALRRGVGANAAARAEQKELWRRVPNSFPLSARRAPARDCVGRDGGGRGHGGAPSVVWPALRVAPWHACPGRGEGGVARHKTPPSVSLVPMAPLLGTKRWEGAPRCQGPKVAPGQGPFTDPY